MASECFKPQADLELNNNLSFRDFQKTEEEVKSHDLLGEGWKPLTFEQSEAVVPSEGTTPILFPVDKTPTPHLLPDPPQEGTLGLAPLGCSVCVGQP